MEKVTAYQSFDGRLFYFEDMCRQYEETRRNEIMCFPIDQMYIYAGSHRLLKKDSRGYFIRTGYQQILDANIISVGQLHDLAVDKKLTSIKGIGKSKANLIAKILRSLLKYDYPMYREGG